MSSADDWIAIQNILATYVIAIDTRDIDLFDRVFVPDAKIELANVGVFDPAGYGALCRENLLKMDATQHHLGLPAIRIDGDAAHARTYFVAQHSMNNLAPAAHLTIGGWYDDALVRTGEGWRIRERTGTAVWFDGNPLVLGYDFPMGAAPRGPGHAAPAWLRA